uniref:Resistin like beta n=1 Tax=Ovis aries TaxID=9940 RepID=A0AC11AY04_SHEEP
MKPTSCFLLITIPLLIIPWGAPYSLNCIIDKKIKNPLIGLELKSATEKMSSCFSVKNSGKLSSCPAGSVVTGSACGYTCGSWDIWGKTTCHGQCSPVDRTTACCCHLT